ncbi:MAG TPA: histidinol dehydrogenase, partial [Bacillota bacterium]|nr:histidinol dehydrogenase [Bacillota bacterium]
MKIVTADQFNRNRNKETIDQAIDEAVFNIIQDVRKNKDRSLKKYTKQFDQVNITDFIVSDKEIEEAKKYVGEKFLKAIKRAIKNITAFHEEQREKSWFITKDDGIMLGQQIQ